MLKNVRIMSIGDVVRWGDTTKTVAGVRTLNRFEVAVHYTDGTRQVCHPRLEMDVLVPYVERPGVRFAALSLLILILSSSMAAHAAPIPKEVYCVIGEAEGESYTGMLAVSEAIRNRGSLKGVYGCTAPRVTQRRFSPEILRTAQQAWEDSAGSGDITHGATHWEGTEFPIPYWAKSKEVTLVLGHQRFYK